jgi:enoyl-CoA hydratase
MRFGQVEYEIKENTAVITLDDEEKLNALSKNIRYGLSCALDELEKEDEVKVAIITGKGRTFCAGGDISGFSFEMKEVKKFLKEVILLFNRIEKLNKPIIAAVNGLALGGGLELAISCDLIIASQEAKFGTPEINIGLVPAFAMLRLDKIVGKVKAKEIILTGNIYTAEEMLKINLINKVTLPEKLMEEALETAKKLINNSLMAMGFAKSAINRAFGGEDLTYTIDGTAHLFATEDAKEGVSAFLQKRKPSFKDR